MALMLATATIGCAAAPPAVAGPPPPGGLPPPGGPGGFPLVPPPCSPIAILRSSLSSASVRGCCGAIAAAGAAWVAIWVIVWVVVIVVPVVTTLQGRLFNKSLEALVRSSG